MFLNFPRAVAFDPIARVHDYVPNVNFVFPFFWPFCSVSYYLFYLILIACLFCVFLSSISVLRCFIICFWDSSFSVFYLSAFYLSDSLSFFFVHFFKGRHSSTSPPGTCPVNVSYPWVWQDSVLSGP